MMAILKRSKWEGYQAALPAQNAGGVAEGGGDQQARAAADGGETPIGGAQGGEVLRDAILDEGALVELHPFGALGSEPLEEVGVDIEERVEERERVESRLGGGPGQQQKGDRAEQDGLGDDPQCTRLEELVDGLGRGELEPRAPVQLGDD